MRFTAGLLFALLALSARLVPAERAATPDGVFGAMKAELQRSQMLQLGELERPYFISYSVDDVHVWSASAMLGGLIVGLVESFTGIFISQAYTPAMVSLLLIAFLLVRPAGLFGRAAR